MQTAQMAATYALCFPGSRAWTVAEFQQFQNDPKAISLGEDKAFIILNNVLDEAEIITLAVHPDQRRKGMAMTLLADAERALRAKGITRLFLEVAEDNQAALALYQKTQFQTIGRRKGYYVRSAGHKVDAILLEKRFKI